MRNTFDTNTRDIEAFFDSDLPLPSLVQTIISVIGLPATIQLVKSAGGTSIAIPSSNSKSASLRYEYIVELIGANAADALVAHFSNDTIYIPSCRQALTEFLHREIRAKFDTMTSSEGGYSSVQAVASLALSYKYSDRHIWSILKRSNRQNISNHNDDKQLNLF